MATVYQFITIDDEKATHVILDHFLKEYNDLKSEGQFSDPFVALKQINEHDFDLLFLDIDMPFINGFELIDQLKKRPLIIMITAHAQRYALNGYQYLEKGVIDFIEKPVDKVRLDKAIQRFYKIKTDHQLLLGEDSILETFSEMTIQVQKKDKWCMLSVNDIKIIAVNGNYIFITSENGDHYSKYCSMEDILKQLPNDIFIQVNRQQTVNILQIKTYSKDIVSMGKNGSDEEILVPISIRRQKEALAQIKKIKHLIQ
jgi:two-component system, LytTR family, response regulator